MNRKTIPLWIKLAYTGFVMILVPYYLHAYGPTNFLYFCDVALLLTTVALWSENSLLVSASIVGILLPQLLWMVDFIGALRGHSLTGMTAYMFNPVIPLFTRFLSFFHFWLPLFLLWLVSRLGYDRRAFKLWTMLAWLLLVVSYLFLPPPPAPADNPALPVNVNYVFGPSDAHPQEWMPLLLYLTLLLTLLPSLVLAYPPRAGPGIPAPVRRAPASVSESTGPSRGETRGCVQPEYEQTIMGIYANLGSFLIRAAKELVTNASLIWFTMRPGE